MMTETQNPARGNVIQPFDDTAYRSKLADFQRYLADCKRLMESERVLVSQPDNAAPNKPTRKQAPVVSSSRYVSRHVYILPAGASREPVTVGISRPFVAPLWASMNEVSERKAAA